MSDFVFRQVQRELPGIAVLLPPDPPGDPLNLLSWRAMGCSMVLDEGIKPLMGLGDSPQVGAHAPFELREVSHLASGWYAPGGIPMHLVLEHCREAVIACLHRIFHDRLMSHRVDVLTLFRQVHERICGRAVERSAVPHHVRARTLNLALRSLRLRDVRAAFPEHHFYGKRKRLPVMFLVGDGNPYYLRLRDYPPDPAEAGGNGRVLKITDLRGLFRGENVFRNYAASLLNDFQWEAEHIFAGDPPERPDLEKDRLFFEALEAAGSLPGRGEHKRFAVELRPMPDGHLFRIKLSLGARPFLMQVCRGCGQCDSENATAGPGCDRCAAPTYTLWDLRRHPIHVVWEVRAPADGRVLFHPAGSVVLHAESDHRSICCHPFVKCLGRDGSRRGYFGSICMEHTERRIVAGNTETSPDFLLLQTMKAAARILKYGLRHRDRRIPQHNPFRRIRSPTGVFQGVVEGRRAAEEAAARLDAEIVDYFR